MLADGGSFFADLRNDPEALRVIERTNVIMGETSMLLSASPLLKYMVWVPAIRQLNECNKSMFAFYERMFENFRVRHAKAERSPRKPWR
jgi:hypothetical protein